MQEMTRRAALRGTAAVAAVSAAGMVAAPVLAVQSNPDARVLALIEEHGTAARLSKAAWRRWREVVHEALGPRLQPAKYSDMSPEDRDLFHEILGRHGTTPLSDEAQRLEDECKAVVERLAETPARTLEGIHAKFQDAIKRGGHLGDIAQSAVDDLGRLVGEG